MKPLHFSPHEVATIMLGWTQTAGMVPKDGREYHIECSAQGVTISLATPRQAIPPPPKPRHLRLVHSKR